jgi:choline dehydrogenase-like flavoprotein
MVIDAREIEQGSRIDADLCIVGAGAAGITLAKALAHTSLRICLIESGGRQFERRTQSLYRGENGGEHHWPLLQSRRRRYGGSTTAWDGRCRPLDAIDFEARNWIAHSGWPMTRAELDPYYERAATVCQFEQLPDFDADPTDKTPLFTDSLALKTAYFHYPSTLNFAEMYGDEIESAENITLLLHANVTEIVTNDSATTVTQLAAKTLRGNQFTVAARHFVLAAGGIENARLLLASNRIAPAGLGNQHDLIGRYLMNHPHQFFAVLEPALTCPQLDAYITPFHEAKTVTGVWTFRDQFLRDQELVNCAVYLTPRAAFKSTPAYLSAGMDAFNSGLEAIKLRNLPDDPGWHVRRVGGDVGAVMGIFGRKLTNRSSKLVLRIALENVPHSNSRITLSGKRDALGQNRACIDWQLSPIDWHSYRRMVKELSAEFERTGYGRVLPFFDPDGEPWSLPVQDGKHHMGATRMSTDPRHGVVDVNATVHGVANLSVAGSSLFPTGGHANPTFTIVALTIRLADHLKRELLP